MIKLVEREIRKPQGIVCKYFAPDKAVVEDVDILILSVYGNYPKGSLGNEHACYIALKSIIGLQAFNPDCIILDFREMEYTWGNTLLAVFQDIARLMDSEKEDEEPNFPIIVVTSEKCRNGFLSLVTQMEGKEPAWHYENMDSAIEAAIVKGREWLDF